MSQPRDAAVSCARGGGRSGGRVEGEQVVASQKGYQDIRRDTCSAERLSPVDPGPILKFIYRRKTWKFPWGRRVTANSSNPCDSVGLGSSNRRANKNFRCGTRRISSVDCNRSVLFSPPLGHCLLPLLLIIEAVRY